MKTISNFKIAAFISLIGFSACTEQSDDSLTSTNAVTLAPVTMITSRDTGDKLESAPEGVYYFGWTDNKGSKNYTQVTVGENGVAGNGGLISAYWDNINKGKGVTFSNTQDITESGESKDILWDGYGKQLADDERFNLRHKMAQTRLVLTIPENWTVKEVKLTELKKYYAFSNANGTVTPTGETDEIELQPEENTTIGTTATSSILLPPQEKGDDSELQVIINDGTKDRTFHRKLPTSMSRWNSSGNFQEDILLKFEAGYTLNLTANITESTDGEIHFTHATLTDWNNIGSGTISVRPAGIYTVSDWNAFAAAYKDKIESRLRKYGSKTDDSWTFTIQRTIDFTGKSPSQANLTGNDKLTAKDKCIIKGKSAAELGVDGHADNVTFETKTDTK